jgi:hypothetical protein
MIEHRQCPEHLEELCTNTCDDMVARWQWIADEISAETLKPATLASLPSYRQLHLIRQQAEGECH